MTLPPLPEWAHHEAVWIGFPSDPELWLGDLKPAEKEVAAFAKAVHADGKGEKVWLVAAHEGAAESARRLAPFAEVIVEPLANAAGLPFSRAGWILEGGAIDGDGSGTVVTTEQCLLNPNRNSLSR